MADEHKGEEWVEEASDVNVEYIVECFFFLADVLNRGHLEVLKKVFLLGRVEKNK